jgi:putative membrane protein
VRSIGLAPIAAAFARIGAAGFVLYCTYSLAVFGLLGAAWLAAAVDEPWRRVGLFAWARLVREAVSDLLPFSQLGGLVAGARVIRSGGLAWPRVYASIIVDLTTEMASQLVFTLVGLALIASVLLGAGGAAVRPLVLGGTALMVATIAAFLFGQHAMVRFATRLATRMLPQAAAAIGDVEAELRRAYAHRGRVVTATLLNLAGWIGSALGAWLLLRLAGLPLPVWAVLALESLIFTVRSVAFAVPGALGVQEAAYVLAGPLVGLPAEAALALSLGKRARELCLSVPTLAIWYAGGIRDLVRQGRATRAG